MAETKFKQEELVPDVLPQAPKETLRVTFGKASVSLGNELTPTQVQSSPAVSWESDPDGFYTLIFTDPDAPSRANPLRREFLHWLVVNIPGSDLGSGEVLAEFLSSAPPPDSGLHRYTFILFEQSKGKTSFDDEIRIPDTTREGRRFFKTAKFAEKYALGAPVAGNYYLATYDEYVDVINKKLAGT